MTIGPPASTPEQLFPAWASCLMWAVNDPDAIAAFREDTGCKFQPARNGLDRMIDEATGAEAAFVKAFVEWFNSNVWGEIE
jgi:hypothetical protein